MASMHDLAIVMHWAMPVLIIACLTACSEPKLSPLPNDAVILAFGDSLTKGIGANEHESYPSVLASLSGRTVINAGISGEKTHEGLVRFPARLDADSPDLVILLEGGNDILRSVAYPKIEANLSKMIEQAQARNIPLILVGVPEKTLFSNSAPFYETLATEYDVVFEPELIGELMRTSSLKSDPIHLNAKGYAEMANRLYALLVDEGALP